jgi:hypothetical protein
VHRFDAEAGDLPFFKKKITYHNVFNLPLINSFGIVEVHLLFVRVELSS